MTFPSLSRSGNQWCKQYQILKTKTKITRPRWQEVNKGSWWISLLSKWTLLLISTVVMFQAQNTETIWQGTVSFKIIMTTSVTRPCFTTQHQTCKTKTKTDFLVSDRSCPKTDRRSQTTCLVRSVQTALNTKHTTSVISWLNTANWSWIRSQTTEAKPKDYTYVW